MDERERSMCCRMIMMIMRRRRRFHSLPPKRTISVISFNKWLCADDAGEGRGPSQAKPKRSLARTSRWAQPVLLRGRRHRQSVDLSSVITAAEFWAPTCLGERAFVVLHTALAILREEEEEEETNDIFVAV